MSTTLSVHSARHTVTPSPPHVTSHRRLQIDMHEGRSDFTRWKAARTRCLLETARNTIRLATNDSTGCASQCVFSGVDTRSREAFFFFLKDAAPPEIYPLPHPAALPI